MAERWSDPAFERSTPRSSQRLDRLVNAGRQLVDGVSGARPGSRKAGRLAAPGAGMGPGMGPRLGELGRWVEDKLDWILEDDEDWREPWQEPRQQPRPGLGSTPARRLPPPPEVQAQPLGAGGAGAASAARASSRRRPLEAISRRGAGGAAGRPTAAADDSWPDDDSFSRPRWQRSAAESGQGESGPAGPVVQPAPQSVRPVPRSSRRRQSD